MAPNKITKQAQKFYELMLKDHDVTHDCGWMIRKAYRAGYESAKAEFKQPDPVYNKPSQYLIDKMKLFCGIPPCDGFSTVAGDSYFAKDLQSRIKSAGCNWDEVHREAVKQGRLIRPAWDNI